MCAGARAFVCAGSLSIKYLLQGIADSEGAIHDFAGPYYIGYDDMAFGRPTRYLILDPKRIGTPSRSWDAGITTGDKVYEKRMHNLM